ncbi:MAG: sulfatase-like hydrolase/transferase [Bacteroidales bacterium]|nr:sulfatase-like hydrolase/transferase [Bacteroidales bacterium]
MIIFKRKYDLAFIVYTVCFPAIACLHAENITINNFILAIFLSLLIGIIVYLISLNFDGIGRKLFLWCFYIILIIPSVIVLSYILIDGTLIKGSNYFIVFETNFNESSEFLSGYLSAKTITILLIYALPSVAYLVFSKKSIIDFRNKKLFSFSIKREKKSLVLKYKYTGIVFILCLIFLLKNENITRNNYILDFYRSFYSFRKIIIKYKECESKRNVKNFIVTTSLPNSANKTFVIIIGEALSKHHMSLYGYERKTNPLLEKIKNELLVYNNVISPHSHTLEVMRCLLTFADNENEKPYFEKPSVIELFNNAGFETYWIENQVSMSKWENTGIISNKAKHFYMANSDDTWFYYSSVFDESALKYLNKILPDKKGKDKVIFVHLMGNHAIYDKRYPHSFAVFDNNKDFYQVKQNLKDNEKKIVNEYDNSVLYNDFVVSSIIEKIKKTEKFSFVIYIPDHGEEVYNFRDYYGHTFSSKSSYMCEIPFILWRSEEFKKEVSISVDTTRPYSTENLIYSLSDLARLNYNDYDAGKSIFSKEFIVRKRMVGELTYEELKAKTLSLGKN